MNSEDRKKSANIATLTVRVGKMANEEARRFASSENHVFAYSTIALSSAFAMIFSTEDKQEYLQACEYAWHTSRDLQKMILEYEKQREKKEHKHDLN